MSRKGRRYTDEPKLNVKKVVAVVILIAVIIMFVFAIKKILKNDNGEKITSTNYFTVYTNEKWGVIDQKGNIVIKPTYDEMIIIPNKTEAVFICTYDVNYTNNTYKTKVLNEANKEIFKEYDKVEPLYNYDKNNNLWYEENVLRVEKNGKYGLINYKGKLILDCNYDKIEAMAGVENSLIITSGDNIGVANTKGSIIIKPEYIEIKAIEDNYKYGYIVKNTENKYGLIDINKKVILEPEYEDVKSIYSSNKYVVKEDGKYKIIDKEKNMLLDNGFDDVIGINGDNIIILKDNKYGVISIAGEKVIDTKYEELKYAFSDCYIAKENGKYGIIKTNEEVALEIDCTSIVYRQEEGIIEVEKDDEIQTKIYDKDLNLKLTGIISEVNSEKGYMKVRVLDDYKYYNFKFEEKASSDVLPNNEIFLSKKDGKYGYVDKKGNVVVDYIYDDATELNSYKYAAVKKNGLWGAIDYTGKVIVEPKYALENNLSIDFIGKWHIGENLNAVYYTDM